jgi:hypothetical protein
MPRWFLCPVEYGSIGVKKSRPNIPLVVDAAYERDTVIVVDTFSFAAIWTVT